MGSFTPQTGYDLFLGRRPSSDLPAYYQGLLDEVSLYSRALSGAEIAALYNADAAGKCPLGVAPVDHYTACKSDGPCRGHRELHCDRRGTAP